MGAKAAPPPNPRTIVCIDGLNLYYGAPKSTPALKWLDLDRYCHLLRPHDDIQLIRYFTALVTGPTKPHQEAYLRALATTPLVSVALGKFKEKTIKCGVTGCSHSASKRFKVPEEKRTDVNIAVSMLDDAYQNRCEHLVLFSGDSDLVPAVNLVRAHFPTKTVTVYVPSTNPIRHAAVELRLAASKHRDLPLLPLAKAQFPNAVPDGSGGTINRPAAWV